MYPGYFKLGGTEVINADRTTRYVQNIMPTFGLQGCDDCPDINIVLGEPEYQSPLQDDAPWVDENNPATAGFYGFYPLALEGSVDDTRSAAVLEGVQDGGTIGQLRRNTREMRYRGMMIAQDRLSLHAGMTWLKAALDPTPCGEHGGTCGGATACLYAACPVFDPDCMEDEAVRQPNLPTGSIAPNTPFTYNFKVQQDALKSAAFLIPTTDGFVGHWGALALTENTVIEDFGPFISRRSNYVLNPNFTNNVSNWVSGGAFTRVANGGVDGGPYAHWTNPTPSYVRTSDMDANFGDVTASFALRGTGVIHALIASIDDGSVLGDRFIQLTPEWTRYFLHAPYGRRVYIAFESAADFDIDRVMMEPSALELPYFDGSTWSDFSLDGKPVTQSDYTLSWDGGADVSPSRMVWNQGATSIFGETAPAGFQYLNVPEICEREWRVTLLSTAGSIPNGTLEYATRTVVPADVQAIKYERNFHNVVVVSGPTVINEYAFSTGAGFEVEFTMVAGVPFAYGTTEDLLDNVPFPSLPNTPFVDIPSTPIDTSPILDPDCPPVPSAPRPPTVPDPCVANPDIWQRYSLLIPGEKISGWSQMLPTIGLSTKAGDIRQVRVRFTPNPFNYPIAGLSRTNVVINPSLTNNATGWASVGTGTATGRVAGAGTNPAWAYRVTATAAHAIQAFGVINSGSNLVTAGTVVQISASVRTSVARTVQLGYSFWDAANVQVGATVYGAAQMTGGPGTFNRLIATNVTVPATAVRVSLRIVNATAAVIGETLDMSQAMVELQSGATLSGGAFFDGNRKAAGGVYYGWGGPVGASVSVAVSTRIDPTAYCSEFILSYLPANAELVVDGLTETAFASISGGPAKPASHLLYGTDGTPMTWPSLSCGIDYVMTVDVPQVDVANVAVSLSLTQQE